MRVYYDLSETDTELGCQDWPRLVVHPTAHVHCVSFE